MSITHYDVVKVLGTLVFVVYSSAEKLFTTVLHYETRYAIYKVPFQPANNTIILHQLYTLLYCNGDYNILSPKSL